jgi:hypothetical protein
MFNDQPDTPGRLRVWTEAITGRERAASDVLRLLASIPGVISATTSTTTGSAVVIYDASCASSRDILGVLSRNGYLDRLAEPALPRASQAVLDWIVERVLAAAFATIL